MHVSFKTKYNDVSHFPCKGVKLKVVALDEVKCMLYTMWSTCIWYSKMDALQPV